MIERVWHGWTTSENADTYETLLKTAIVPGIAAKNVSGYRGIRLLRRSLANGDVEFLTITRYTFAELPDPPNRDLNKE